MGVTLLEIWHFFSSQEAKNTIKLISFSLNCRFFKWTRDRFCHPQHLSASVPSSRCSRCTSENERPQNCELLTQKTERGRNTPAIGSSGSAESVRSHNVLLYYGGNHISIGIVKQKKKSGKQMRREMYFIKCAIIFVPLCLCGSVLPVIEG